MTAGATVWCFLEDRFQKIIQYYPIDKTNNKKLSLSWNCPQTNLFSFLNLK